MHLLGVGLSLAFIFGSLGKWFLAFITVFITFTLFVVLEKEREREKQKAERLAKEVRAVVADMRLWGEPAKGAHVERIQHLLDDALYYYEQEKRHD